MSSCQKFRFMGQDTGSDPSNAWNVGKTEVRLGMMEVKIWSKCRSLHVNVPYLATFHSHYLSIVHHLQNSPLAPTSSECWLESSLVCGRWSAQISQVWGSLGCLNYFILFFFKLWKPVKACYYCGFQSWFFFYIQYYPITFLCPPHVFFTHVTVWQEFTIFAPSPLPYSPSCS